MSNKNYKSWIPKIQCP